MTTAPPLKPLPPPNSPLSASVAASGAQANAISGSVSQGYAQYLSSLDQLVRNGNYPALSVNGNGVLTVAGGQTLTGGFNETPFDFGSIAAGTITPNPSKCLKQTVTNNGAFTIAATGEVGDLELLITNGATAGAITFSGFTKQFVGDALDTTNGHEFVVFIYAFKAAVTAYIIKALQ